MPEFIPLQFYHYNWQDSRINPDNVISPPYDVLSPDDKTALAAERYNIVHLDSPASYHDAAKKLDAWMADSILIRDHCPCFYIMATDYPVGKVRKTRWGIFGGLRVHSFEDKEIFPHEQTYPKAKNDRFSLMKATRGQLSPIFGIFDDPGLIFEDLGQRLLETEPVVVFLQEPGVRNMIWPVPDEHNPVIQTLVHDRKIFIADGHHRYETALDYKLAMPEDPRAPWNHVFIYLSNISSPGLEIFPYHRIVSWKKTFNWNSILESSGNMFDADRVESPGSVFPEMRTDSFILCANKDFYLLTPRKAPEEVFSRIGAHVLDKLFLRRAMDLSDQELASGEFLSYSHDWRHALESVASGQAQAAFLLKPVPMDILRSVCESGRVMPRKSTYFYPKLPTGILFHLWR